MSGRFDRSISSQHAPRGVGVALRVGGLAWLVSWVIALGASLAGVAWLVGVVCSDRWLWSQYASWIPTPAVVLGLASGWLVSSASARAARMLVGTGPVALTRRMRRRLPARAPRRVVVVLGVVATIGLGLEWRVHRYVLAHPRPPGESVRVLFLNAGSVDTSPALDAIRASEPDIVLISNPRYASKRSEIIGGVREAVGLGEEWALGEMHISGRLFFASRATIERSGVVSLGLGRMATVTERDEHGRETTRSVASDAGRAMFLTLRLPAEKSGEPAVEGSASDVPGEPAIRVSDRGAGTITLWVIDVPRDLDRSRAEMMRGARRAIDEWRDPRDPSRFRVDEQGRKVTLIGDRPGAGGGDEVGGSPPAGFPPADLIIGDFNTPRGSWSLGLLAGKGMTGAFAQAGRGPALTWPRERAVEAIDLAFTPSRWRAVEHRAVDLGAGSHRAIIVDVVRAGSR